MSYYLCLAVPASAGRDFRSFFDPGVHLMDASDTPMGQVTRAGKADWSAYFLLFGSSSASLIAKGAIKKTARNHDRSELFISGLTRLLAEESCPSVSFLVHWMRGYITTEEIEVRDRRMMTLTDLPTEIRDIEEDVRYVVTP